MWLRSWLSWVSVAVMPKRWNPLRAATWGAALGAIYAVIALFGTWGRTAPAYLAGQFGELLGSAGGGAVIFGLAAVVRNLAVPKQLQGACLKV